MSRPCFCWQSHSTVRPSSGHSGRRSWHGSDGSMRRRQHNHCDLGNPDLTGEPVPTVAHVRQSLTLCPVLEGELVCPRFQVEEGQLDSHYALGRNTECWVRWSQCKVLPRGKWTDLGWSVAWNWDKYKATRYNFFLWLPPFCYNMLFRGLVTVV